MPGGPRLDGAVAVAAAAGLAPTAKPPRHNFTCDVGKCSSADAVCLPESSCSLACYGERVPPAGRTFRGGGFVPGRPPRLAGCNVGRIARRLGAHPRTAGISMGAPRARGRGEETSCTYYRKFLYTHHRPLPQASRAPASQPPHARGPERPVRAIRGPRATTDTLGTRGRRMADRA